MIMLDRKVHLVKRQIFSNIQYESISVFPTKDSPGYQL